VEMKDPLAATLWLPGVARSESAVRERVDELIDLLTLDAYRDKFISELSTGTRRIVDLACVLGSQPKVVLFDEPSSGIAQREVEALAPLFARIRAETGASMIVIEHDMPLISAVSDELIAMHLGEVLLRGDPAAVLRDPRVIETYLGTASEVVNRSGKGKAGRARRSPRPAKKEKVIV
jgi:ABC-type branched-subunit amino acid transport system ATPase component